MKFELKHTFDATPDTVIAAMVDPTLFDHLKRNMSTIREIEPLERVEEGSVVRRRTRYTPEPLIKSIGPKQVPPGAMAWTEASRFDKAARRCDFENIPNMDIVRKLLVNRGTITFRDVGGRTERTVAGELTVKVFLLGKIAEKIIYREAEKVLNQEAAALSSFLAQHKAAAS